MVVGPHHFSLGVARGFNCGDRNVSGGPFYLYAFLGSRVMLVQFKGVFRNVSEGTARLMLRLGFTPNAVTLFALIMAWLSCALFIWNRNAFLFAGLVFFWSLFDAVDGALARITNRTTKFGAYLDAMCAKNMARPLPTNGNTTKKKTANMNPNSRVVFGLRFVLFQVF